MTTPQRFTAKSQRGDTIYLVELQPAGRYRISWPKTNQYDEGECLYFTEMVNQLLQDGDWEIVKNLDAKPAPTFTEKCQALGLDINYQRRQGGIEVRSGIIGGVSVNDSEGLNLLIDVLYEYRVR